LGGVGRSLYKLTNQQMKEETTLVRISKKLKNQLKRMSGEKDTTIKELVEKAVIEKLKSQKDV
jgi:hypothetical protein